MTEESEGAFMRDLGDFLLNAFEVGEVKRFIRHNQDGLQHDLPAGTPRDVVSGWCEAMANRGILDDTFFEALLTERPKRRAEIEALQHRWQSIRAKPPATTDAGHAVAPTPVGAGAEGAPAERQAPTRTDGSAGEPTPTVPGETSGRASFLIAIAPTALFAAATMAFGWELTSAPHTPWPALATAVLLVGAWCVLTWRAITREAPAAVSRQVTRALIVLLPTTLAAIALVIHSAPRLSTRTWNGADDLQFVFAALGSLGPVTVLAVGGGLLSHWACNWVTDRLTGTARATVRTHASALALHAGLATLAVAASIPILASAFRTFAYASGTGSWWTWPSAALHHVALLLTGEIAPTLLARAPDATKVVVCGSVALTPLVVCLAHIAGDLIALAVHALPAEAAAPLRAERARTLLARPQVWLGIAVLGALTVSYARHARSGPGGLPAYPWSTISVSECLTGACDDYLCARPTADDPRTDFQLMPFELDNQRWRSVWRSGYESHRHIAERLPWSPSPYTNDSYPVTSVTWCETVRFLNLWSLTEGLEPAYCEGRGCSELEVDALEESQIALAGCEAHIDATIEWRTGAGGYRLPTDFEWEVAATGGTPTRFWTGADLEDALQVEWLSGNSMLRPRPVHTRPIDGAPEHPNGLFGVHGNAREWLWSPPQHRTDPTQCHEDSIHHRPRAANRRMLRGGAFDIHAAYAGLRFGSVANPRAFYSSNLGFRPARALPAPRPGVTP